MKFFIRLFIFLLIIGAAAYGYAWYKNKQAWDDLIIKNGGSYDTTYVDINGDSVIKGISFQIPGLAQPATIESLRTGTGNILSNIKVSKAIASKDLASLPEYFDVYLDVVAAQLPLDPIMDQATGNQPNFFNKASFAGCGDRTQLSFYDLGSMGINALKTDSKIKFSFDNASKKVFSDFYINLDKFNTTKLNLTLDNFSFNNPMGITLANGSIEVADNGVQRDILSLCANEAQLTEQQFTERHISYLKHLLFQENVFFSPEFYQEYAKYYANPRSIKFSFNPTNSLAPVSLMGSSARRLLSTLNVNIALNDKTITPLFGNRPDPSELPELDKVTPEDDGLTTIYGLKLQDTAVSSMAKYVGYDVHFNYRGKKYKGDIISVGGSTANIRYEISTGNYVEKPFRLSEISDLLVRREQVQPTTE